jgi:predicted transcriptional regulator
MNCSISQIKISTKSMANRMEKIKNKVSEIEDKVEGLNKSQTVNTIKT